MVPGGRGSRNSLNIFLKASTSSACVGGSASDFSKAAIAQARATCSRVGDWAANAGSPLNAENAFSNGAGKGAGTGGAAGGLIAGRSGHCFRDAGAQAEASVGAGSAVDDDGLRNGGNSARRLTGRSSGVGGGSDGLGDEIGVGAGLVGLGTVGPAGLAASGAGGGDSGAGVDANAGLTAGLGGRGGEDCAGATLAGGTIGSGGRAGFGGRVSFFSSRDAGAPAEASVGAGSAVDGDGLRKGGNSARRLILVRSAVVGGGPDDTGEATGVELETGGPDGLVAEGAGGGVSKTGAGVSAGLTARRGGGGGGGGGVCAGAT